ncbi:MAG: hypothetical protein LBF22_00015 [Deltaproteobacteria bacterium]|nr:hypothetical protein [Deltaproteobacteria bacterium]
MLQDKLGPGLWYFHLSEEPLSLDNMPLPSPMIANPSALVGKEPFTPSVVTQVEGQPTLRVYDDSPERQLVYSISPLSYEGELTGLMFYAEDVTHIAGLGASFQMMATNINHLGQVFMPGGLYGNRLQLTEQGRTSGLQAPICYTLGNGLKTGALFVDETRPLMWDFSTNPWVVSLAGPLPPGRSISFFVITGENLPQVRRIFMNLVGLPPVPPRSIFAPWVVDTSAVKPNEALERAKTLRAQLGNPRSMGILFHLPTDQLPYTAAKQFGIELMVREAPYVPLTSPFYGDLSKRGFLVRNSSPSGPPLVLNYEGVQSGLLDYTDPAAATYWHSLSRDTIVQLGGQVFYLTGGEPEVYSPLAWYRGVSDQNTHSHYTWSSRFSLKWMEGILLGLRNQTIPRPFIPRNFLFSRAGLGGMSRFGAGLHSLEPNVFFPPVTGQARAHIALSGVDYNSFDITTMLKEWPLDRFRLLYEAWGARSVLMNLPFVIPDIFLGEPWVQLNLTLKAILEPYYYSLAHQASLTGDPLVAPLMYYFQEDPVARDRSSEFMLGPHLLIGAGIMQGVETLKVYLPKGRWHEFLTGDLFTMEEGGEVTFPAKQEGIHFPPILFREGSIIPTYKEPNEPDSPISINIFPGDSPTSFNWVEDNGINMRYLLGEKVVTTLDLVPSANADGLVTFTIRARVGFLPDTPSTRSFILNFVGLGNVKVAKLDGEFQDRVSLPQDLGTVVSGWYSQGIGPLIFKTPNLDLSKDHVITIER